jgi:nucleoside-triphosphatase THEP1
MLCISAEAHMEDRKTKCVSRVKESLNLHTNLLIKFHYNTVHVKVQKIFKKSTNIWITCSTCTYLLQLTLYITLLPNLSLSLN